MPFTYDTDIDKATTLIREAGQSISEDLLVHFAQTYPQQVMLPRREQPVDESSTTPPQGESLVLPGVRTQ